MAKAMPSSTTLISLLLHSLMSGCALSTTRGTRRNAIPYNPNSSPEGITGLCNADGRFSILMPHPERVWRTAQMSWHPADWGEASPWLRMFRNARVWLG